MYSKNVGKIKTVIQHTFASTIFFQTNAFTLSQFKYFFVKFLKFS